MMVSSYIYLYVCDSLSYILPSNEYNQPLGTKSFFKCLSTVYDCVYWTSWEQYYRKSFPYLPLHTNTNKNNIFAKLIYQNFERYYQCDDKIWGVLLLSSLHYIWYLYEKYAMYWERLTQREILRRKQVSKLFEFSRIIISALVLKYDCFSHIINMSLNRGINKVSKTTGTKIIIIVKFYKANASIGPIHPQRHPKIPENSSI